MTRHAPSPLAGLLVGLLALAASPAVAQDEVETSALLIPDGTASNAALAAVNIGIRRGIRDVEGVRFVHPVDRVGGQSPPEDVTVWLDQLDAIAEQVRSGDPEDGFQRADQAIRVFEDNLIHVRRSQLVDAYMSAAVGRCRARRRRECRAIFERIVTFREGHEYDADRYGGEAQGVFDQAKLRALGGARGTLVVETFPEGAEVYVDGRSYGPSPVIAVGLLAGDHYVTVKELGYHEFNARAEVRGTQENVVHYELAENTQQMGLLNLRGPVRDELGMQNFGPQTRSVFSELGTTQVIFGVVTGNQDTGPDQVHVHLYLYHVVTRLLQNEVEGVVSVDELGIEQARQLAIGLYEGVDLGGGIDAPEDDTVVHGRQPELYEQWWFWLTVIGGAAVIAGAIGVGVALSDGDQVPGGFIRIQGPLP